MKEIKTSTKPFNYLAGSLEFDPQKIMKISNENPVFEEGERSLKINEEGKDQISMIQSSHMSIPDEEYEYVQEELPVSEVSTFIKEINEGHNNIYTHTSNANPSHLNTNSNIPSAQAVYRKAPVMNKKVVSKRVSPVRNYEAFSGAKQSLKKLKSPKVKRNKIVNNIPSFFHNTYDVSHCFTSIF